MPHDLQMRFCRGFETLVLTTIPRTLIPHALTRFGSEIHAEERHTRDWLMGTDALTAVAMRLGYLLVDYPSGG